MKKLIFTLLFLITLSLQANAGQNMAFMSTEADDNNIVIHPSANMEFDFNQWAFTIAFDFSRDGYAAGDYNDDGITNYQVIRTNPVHTTSIYFWPLETTHTAGAIFVPSSTSGGYLYSTVNVCDGQIHHIVIKRTALNRLSISIDNVENVHYDNDTFYWTNIADLHLLQRGIGYISNIKVWNGSTLVLDAPFSTDLLDHGANNLWVELAGSAALANRNTTIAYTPQSDAPTSTEATVLLTNTNQDGQYLSTSDPPFLTDTEETMGDNAIAVGNLTTASFGTLSSAVYFPITIPAGATITTAYIKFLAKDLTSSFPTAGVNCTISGEKTNAPDVWSTLEDYTTRNANKTTSTVTWNGATLDYVSYNYTPELKTLVQEIVNTGGTTGLPFFFDNNESTDGNLYFFYGYRSGTTTTPKFYVSYTTSGGEAVTKVLPWRIQ